MDKSAETAFSYHNDGEHHEYTLNAWRDEVSEDATILGYEEWVHHQIESN
jgi:hypothetical protein